MRVSAKLGGMHAVPAFCQYAWAKGNPQCSGGGGGGDASQPVQSPGAGAAPSFYVPGDKYAACPPGYTAVSDPGGGGTQCVLTGGGAPPAAPPPAAPASVQANISPTITVSPAIQTAISPQISPVFQQAFQPTGSPMTAGTTQQAPATYAADTGVAPPYYAAPSYAPPAYASPVPAAPAPAYSAPPLPVMEDTAPMPSYVPSPAPQTVATQQAVAAPKAEMPWLPFALLGGGLFLMIAMRGKRK